MRGRGGVGGFIVTVLMGFVIVGYGMGTMVGIGG